MIISRCVSKCVSGVRKRVASKGLVLADFPWAPKTGTRVQKTERRYQKLERGYKKRNHGTKNRNEGIFAKTTILQNRPFVFLSSVSGGHSAFASSWVQVTYWALVLWAPFLLQNFNEALPTRQTLGFGHPPERGWLGRLLCLQRKPMPTSSAATVGPAKHNPHSLACFPMEPLIDKEFCRHNR